MIHTERISVRSEGHTDIINITDKVSEMIKRLKMKNGVANIFVSGSTASVSTIEYEPNLVRDMKRVLDKIASYDAEYEHHKTWGDDNGAAHVRATMLGPSVTVPFEDKRLLLGQWQQLAVLDFDTRPRNREVIIQLIGE